MRVDFLETVESVSKEFSTKCIHKSEKSEMQKCPRGVFYKTVSQECPTKNPTRVSTRVPHECVSHKRVRQECPARLSFAVSPVSQE